MAMKKVEAIIAPSKLDAVRDSLMGRGVNGLSVSEVGGCGHEPGRMAYYRGSPYHIDFHPKLKLEIVVRDEDAIPTAYVISDAARTGGVGDGKIMILTVEDAVRVRTGEHGLAAIYDRVEPPVERRWAAVG
jgi:nitrogen regulatory protein P-II 1